MTAIAENLVFVVILLLGTGALALGMDHTPRPHE